MPKPTTPPSEDSENHFPSLSRGNSVFFGRGPKEGINFTECGQKKYLSTSGISPTPLCLSCLLMSMRCERISRCCHTAGVTLPDKGIEWLMSNRCKHSEYWQKKKKHIHTKNPVLKTGIKLSFCKAEKIFYSSTRGLWQQSKALFL